MLKVFKYEFYNLIRSPAIWLYSLFLFFITAGFTWFTEDPSKTTSAVLTLTIFLMPIITMTISIMDYYNSREFVELLLSYPLKRGDVYTGKFFAQILSLVIAYSIGYLVPIVIKGWFYEYTLSLYISGIMLTGVFVSLSLMFGVLNDDKVSGLAFVVGFWLFSTLGYDTLVLGIALYLRNYPVEKIVIPLMFLNPVDLSRILVVLKLDVAALMGYTGALFKEFLYSKLGILMALASIFLWIIIPYIITLRIFYNKDW